jgi:hypothetical protein
MKHFSKFLALGLLSAAAPLAFAGTIPSPVTIAFGNYNPTPTGNTQPLNNWNSPGPVNHNNYTESGFTVSQVSGTDYLNANQGDVAPGISAPGSSAATFSVATTGGSLDFLLSSFTVAAGSSPYSFSVTGYDGATLEWTYTATASASPATGPCPVGYTRSVAYCYETLSLPAVDEVGVTSVDFASASGQSGTFDNITLTPSAPEPSSLVLLGTGLVSACGVLYRKRRTLAL